MALTESGDHGNESPLLATISCYLRVFACFKYLTQEVGVGWCVSLEHFLPLVKKEAVEHDLENVSYYRKH